MGRARVESGEKDAESSKGDAKRSDIEVKSVRRFVVRDVLLKALLFAARVASRLVLRLRLGGGLEEDLSCDLVRC